MQTDFFYIPREGGDILFDVPNVIVKCVLHVYVIVLVMCKRIWSGGYNASYHKIVILVGYILEKSWLINEYT